MLATHPPINMATVAPVKENKMQDAMVEQVETKSAFINKKYNLFDFGQK